MCTRATFVPSSSGISVRTGSHGSEGVSFAIAGWIEHKSRTARKGNRGCECHAVREATNTSDEALERCKQSNLIYRKAAVKDRRATPVIYLDVKGCMGTLNSAFATVLAGPGLCRAPPSSAVGSDRAARASEGVYRKVSVLHKPTRKLHGRPSSAASTLFHLALRKQTG
jgi:hypothetical protein